MASSSRQSAGLDREVLEDGLDDEVRIGDASEVGGGLDPGEGRVAISAG